MSDVEPLIAVKEQGPFQKAQADLGRQLKNAEHYANKKRLESREEAGKVADIVRELRYARKLAEEAKLVITAPHRATTDSVNVAFNELLAQPKAAEGALKDLVHRFNQAEKAKAREAERQEIERRQKEQEDAIKDAEAARELADEDPDDDDAQRLLDESRQRAAEAASAPPPTPKKEPTQVRGNVGRVGSRTYYKWEVVDKAALIAGAPHLVDVVAASVKGQIDGEKASAKAQERPFNLDLIPGIRIWTEEKPVG